MSRSRHDRRVQAPCAACGGLSLIEVLIALVILSIGLLGLAGLQTTSLQFNTSAYYRTQATALAYGLADRMRGNRDAAIDDDAYTAGLEDPPPACDADWPDGGSPAQDVARWRNELACRLPLGTGSVVRDGTEFTITVQWDDSRGADAAEQFAFTTGL